MTETTFAPITLIRADEIKDQTAQTDHCLRLVGVDDSVGASNIWMGRVRNAGGEWSAAHHHGEAQTAGFMLSGHARIYFGDDFAQYIDMAPGDFCYVPPFVPHIEGNLSDTEPCVFVTARVPGNIVVNLPINGSDVHAAWRRTRRTR